jgi:hypothetical protein
MISRRWRRIAILAGVVGVPAWVWVVSVSLSLGIECNKKTFAGNQTACSAALQDTAFCTHWTGDPSCNTQQGGTGGGPQWYFACSDPTSNPYNHCIIANANCILKYKCSEMVMGCFAQGDPLKDPQGNPVYLQAPGAFTEKCDPKF